MTLNSGMQRSADRRNALFGKGCGGVPEGDYYKRSGEQIREKFEPVNPTRRGAALFGNCLNVGIPTASVKGGESFCRCGGETISISRGVRERVSREHPGREIQQNPPVTEPVNRLPQTAAGMIGGALTIRAIKKKPRSILSEDSEITGKPSSLDGYRTRSRPSQSPPNNSKDKYLDCSHSAKPCIDCLC